MRVVDQLQRRINVLSEWFDLIARGSVVLVMLAFCANIASRLFGHPIIGVYEMVSFSGSMAISFALPYCTVKQGHISVELLTCRLGKRTQALASTFTGLLSLGLFVILTWQAGVHATNMWQSGVITPNLKWPPYPFIYGVAFGSGLVCLHLLLEIIRSSLRMVEK